MVGAAARWWRVRYGRPTSDPAFLSAVPEELLGEMIDELHDRRRSLEDALVTAEPNVDRGRLLRELAEVEEALGLRQDGDPIRTGDPLVDYWMAKQMSGEITPEDLELTVEDIRRKAGGR